MLAAILVFRFAIRVSLLETAGWVGFIFLQVPRRSATQRCTTPPIMQYTSVILKGYRVLVYSAP